MKRLLPVLLCLLFLAAPLAAQTSMDRLEPKKSHSHLKPKVHKSKSKKKTASKLKKKKASSKGKPKRAAVKTIAKDNSVSSSESQIDHDAVTIDLGGK
jgi:hypothetical protein